MRCIFFLYLCARAHVKKDETKHAPISKLTVRIDHENNNAVSFILCFVIYFGSVAAYFVGIIQAG